MLKIMLTVLYGVLVFPAHVVGRWRGRDSLLLRKPARDSYWLSRAPVTDVQSYFSPGSARVGNGVTAETPAATATWLAPLYVLVARWFAPRRGVAAETPTASAAARDQGIPDEIYTLW